MMNNNRVPEYFTDGLYNLGRAQRLGNNASTKAAETMGNVIANATFTGSELALGQVAKEELLAEKSQFEESQLNVDKNLAELAKKNRFNSQNFEKAAEEQKSGWLKKIPSDKQQEYSLMFDKYKQRYAGNVTNNEQTLIREKQKATFLTAAQKYYDEATLSSRNGDQDRMQENINGYMRVRNDLMQGGHLSGEAYVRMGQNFSDNVELQRYLGDFDTIKKQGQEAVGQYIGQFMNRQDIPVDRRKKFANAMLSDYQSFQAQNAVALSGLRENSIFIQNSLALGIEPQIDTAEILSGLKASGDIKEYEKLNQSIALGSEIKEFVKLTPMAMSEEIKTLHSQVASPEDLKKLGAMQKAYSSTVKDLYDDPMQFAISRKVIDDSGFDLTQPQTMPTRLQNGKLLQAKYHLSYTPIITKQEAGTLARAIANNDSRTNAALLGELFDGLGGYSEDVFKKIAPKNPQFVHAASIYQSDPQTAVNILEGVEIVKNQPEYTPKSTMDFDETYYSLISGDLFSEKSSEWQKNLKDTVKASLAKINFDNGKSDREVDSDAVEQAIKNVIGNIAKIEMDSSGVLWDSSFKVPLPHNASADDFEDWYQSLNENDFSQAVNLEGLRPSIEEIHSGAILHYISDNQYRVRLGGELLYDQSGKPFVLTYKKSEG